MDFSNLVAACVHAAKIAANVWHLSWQQTCSLYDVFFIFTFLTHFTSIKMF